MRRALLYLIVGGLLLPSVSFGQSSTWAVEIGTGFFIKHNTDVQFDINGALPFAEAKWVWQTNDAQDWAKYHRYPRIKLAARTQYLGIQEVTGWSIGLYPSIDIPIWKHAQGEFSFAMGSGLSYHTRFFDPNDNPTNNAIGSAWNNISRFQLRRSFSFQKLGTSTICLGFNHLSNGGSQTPNRGINSWSVSWEWSPGISRKGELEKMNNGDPKPWVFKKWYWDVQWSVGLREGKNALGPKYRVYSLQTDLVYAFDPIQRWRLGVEWERNMQLVDFYSRQWQTENRSEALGLGSSWSVYIADEFVFGPSSVSIYLGYFLDTRYTGTPIYNKLAFRYYIPFQEDRNKGLYFTVVLKSRLATAEYIGLGIGYRI